MEKDREHLVESLLDLHLNRLDEYERMALEAACRDDPELQAASDRLRQTLRPLDQWTVPTASNLADRVLSHIDQASRIGGGQAPLPMESVGRPQWPFVSMRGLIAVAACIAILFGVFVPGISKLRYDSRRAVCANNMGSIFRGTTMYQAAFGGALPFVGGTPGAAWLPSAEADRPFESNSRHIYLLVKLNFGPEPGDFVCPGGGSGVPMQTHDLGNCGDFGRACNISYATLNLAGPSPNLRPKKALAYISDANPLFVNARFDPNIDPDKANSFAHQGKGQTVLTLDGATRWMTTPIYGPQKDNVWLAGNIRKYTGTETPTSRDDAQLVPGFPVTDPSIPTNTPAQ